MPAKKRASRPPNGGGPVMVILEEIRSQNRATIEPVEAHHQEASRQIHDFRAEVRGQLDAVITADYRDRLHRLEERVEALEHRSA